MSEDVRIVKEILVPVCPPCADKMGMSGWQSLKIYIEGENACRFCGQKLKGLDMWWFNSEYTQGFMES